MQHVFIDFMQESSVTLERLNKLLEGVLVLKHGFAGLLGLLFEIGLDRSLIRSRLDLAPK